MKDSAFIEFAKSVSKSLDNYADAMLMLADNCNKLAEHIVRLHERIEQLEQSKPVKVDAPDYEWCETCCDIYPGCLKDLRPVPYRNVIAYRMHKINSCMTWKPKDKSDLKWCNTCKHGDAERNRCTMSSLPRGKGQALLDWYDNNTDYSIPYKERTIDDVNESCPCHEPRVKKNCDSCGNYYIDGDGDRLCKVMVSKAFNSEDVNKWIIINYCYKCARCKQVADNCPGWKPKE